MRLIPVLESEREPDVAKYEFFFHAENMHELQLPERLADSLLTRHIDSVVVRTEKSIHGPYSPILSLHVYTEEGLEPEHEQPPTARFTIDPTSGASVAGEFYNEEHDTVTGLSVPHAEIRKTIASLIFPSKDGDYQDFADMNLLADNIHPALNNALRKHADASATEARYYLHEDGNISGWLSYELENAQPRRVEVYDIRKSIAGASSTHELIDEEAGLQVEIIREDDSVGISFYECRGPVGAENMSVPYAFELKDIDDMNEHLTNQLSLLTNLASVQTIPLEEHHGSHLGGLPD